VTSSYDSAYDRVSSDETETDCFPAIVIGSGFGGAVVAHHLQESLADRGSVLVLERGMPYPPRSFPRTPREMGRNFWDPQSYAYGLFEAWRFEHSTVLTASGLGGGSLIYANVMLEKPDWSFTAADEANGGRPWPITGPQLRKHYQDVREKLKPFPLPKRYHEPPKPPAAVPKTRQFRDAAAAAGFEKAELAELAISFADDDKVVEPGVPLGHENLHRRERHTCTLVGECDLGCNEGAKNTLDYNYLTEFQKLGGTIRTCCEAVEIARCEDGYEVRYLQHLPARDRVLARGESEGFQDNDAALLDRDERPGARVRAKVVVLAAGALGSTRLLLASQPGLGPLSPQLGRRFSSNGDMLLFARECSEPGGGPRDLASSRGPVITAYATDENSRDGLWLEDAGGPVAAEWGWQLPDMPRALAHEWWSKRRELLKRALTGEAGRGLLSGDLAGVLGAARASSAMLPMLAMGRDEPGGRMLLHRDGLSLDWDPAGSARHFERAMSAGANVARELGGNPWPRARWGRRSLRGLTVHPLGGCAMGTQPSEGVVDSNGQVFGCPDLFVCDGSIMPGPVGPNPSMTIAAIAGHVSETVIERVKHHLANTRPGP